MSIVNQNQQYINPIIDQALRSVIGDRNIGNFAQALNQTLPQLVQAEVYPLLCEAFDTGQVLWNEVEIQQMVFAIVEGIAFAELSRYGFTYNTWAQSYDYLFRRRSMRGGQGMVVQPNTQFVYNTPATINYNAPVAGNTAFVNSAPGVSSINNLGVSSLTSTPPQQGVNMQQSNHMPAVPPTNAFEIRSEPIPQPKQEFKIPETEMSTPLISIPLIDKTNIEFTNQSSSPACCAYMSIRECLSKPVLISTEEDRWLPLFNVSEEVTQAIAELTNQEDLEGIFSDLNGLAMRMSINGLMGWLDTRISRTVEMAIRYRYNQAGIDVCHYREDMTMIDGWLENVCGKAAVLDIHTIVKTMIENLLTVTKIVELQETDDKDIGKYVAATTNDYLLTLPWKISYRYSDNDVAIKNVSKQQLFDILNQAWDIIEEESRISINIVDIAGNRYRAYRKGTTKFGGAQWHIEAFMS